MIKMTVAAALLFGTSSLALAQAPQPPLNAGPGPAMQSPPPPVQHDTLNPARTELSGSSSALMNEAQVRQKLETDGYRDVSDIKRDTNGWTAHAMFNGKGLTVDIDNTGKIEAQ